MAEIDLDLYYPIDTPAIHSLKTALNSLVNAHISAASAASTIDALIVTDCQTAHRSYTSVPNPTREQIDNGDILAPDPDSWLSILWRSIGRAAMVVPYEHAGQDRMVELILELQKLPRKKLPWVVLGEVMEDKEMYDLTEKNGWDGLLQWLWQIDQSHFSGMSEPEHVQAYLNFSAFLARLLAVGIGAGVQLCALHRRPDSAFATQRIAWTKKYADSEEQVKHYAPYAAAAAIWLLYAGDVIFGFCDEGCYNFGGNWKRSSWESWREKFEEVVGDERFDEGTKGLVGRALERMFALEKGGWKVHEEEEEDDDDEEEDEEEERMEEEVK